MVLDPKNQDHQFNLAGSLFFFIVAILVVLFGAALEGLQHTVPLQLNGSVLLLLLVLGLAVAISGLHRLFR